MASLSACVYAHSRVQFHPAAYALLYAVIFIALMTLALFVLSMLFAVFGSSGVVLDYVTFAAVFGPVLLGELVRGHVKAWFGHPPEFLSFAAIAAAGLSAGGTFGTLMALQWGRPPWLELLGWGGGTAALYLSVGWLIRFDERRKSRENAEHVTE